MSLLGQKLRSRLLRVLPRGGSLPLESWRQRHRAIVVLLWLHVAGLAAASALRVVSVEPIQLGSFVLVSVLAAAATVPNLSCHKRSVCASSGLVMASSLLVHASNGVAELDFLVTISVLALYEEWLPFVFAVGGYLADDALVRVLAPSFALHQPPAFTTGWLRGLVDNTFILGAAAASLVNWRHSEFERAATARERGERLREQLARHSAEIELVDLKQVEAALQRQAHVLAEQAQLLELAQDAMFVWELESGAIKFWNRGAEELYGWPREEVIGRTPQQILKTEFPRPLSELRESLERTGRWEGELIHSCRDGSAVVVMSRWALQQAGEGAPLRALAINSNITDQKRARAELEYQARRDAVTGLPNRIMLGARVDAALADARANGSQVALLMLDLDRFKDVNDTLGHAAGDELLRAVGPRLTQQMRSGDLLARLGGDEFAVLLPDTGVVDAQTIARAMLEALELPFQLREANVQVAASIGIAAFPEHGPDAETLVRCADVAMYVAKRSALGSSVYMPDQDPNSRDRLALASDLRGAIKNGELVLHYQPKIGCATGELVGVEALVRWRHPERGLLRPDQFIPVAEQSGLIGLLGRCVLDLALRQCRVWKDGGLSVPVAVNLSMRDMLDVELPADVQRLLAKWELDASCLRVEITESSLMVDPVRSRATLERLCELGIKLSVDDYGTGYSSLVYLQQLPVDELKIDRSFVRQMATNSNDQMIVRSTIDLAHGLGLTVVAEGVEDAPTLQRLRLFGCDQAQGYHLCRPTSADDLTRWLEAPGSLAA